MTEPTAAPALFTVTGPQQPGRLSTMARPRGHGHLAADMAALRGVGTDILVCALPDAERAALGIADEPCLAREAGLRFVPLPIPDLTVPPVPAVLPVLEELAEALRAGAHIVAHCRCAIGRSSLIAVSVLILNGTAPEAAWASMERARERKVPDTEEQRAWSLELFRLVSSGRQDPDPDRYRATRPLADPAALREETDHGARQHRSLADRARQTTRHTDPGRSARGPRTAG
ncbi:tyrosine protein phosphatase [Streptomyces decoyicus]|uniref:tyrosine protein phosphatase n=1 Tax=Streptomyces decoyicus TaxID=249567 RepID=UPI00345D0A92